jgi:hypothetical protein
MNVHKHFPQSKKTQALVHDNLIVARRLHNTAQKDLSSVPPMSIITAGKYGPHPLAPLASPSQSSSNTSTLLTPLLHPRMPS